MPSGMPVDRDHGAPGDEEESMLDLEEVDQEIDDGGEDVAMDSGDEDMEDQVIELQNDSAAYFDVHKDSIFCIAQHPKRAELIVTGGGDDIAYIFDSTPAEKPLLPRSYESVPQPAGERQGLPPIATLDGHTESVNAVAFSLPKGEYVITADLKGQIRVWRDIAGDGMKWEFLAAAQEVQEVNWLAVCPSPEHPNCFAFGAGDGSVWVYEIQAQNTTAPLAILQAFYLHTMASTAGTWTANGKLLATVSEDGSLYVWDVWGDAAAMGLVPAGAQSVVGLTADDERFKVEGGLYSVAISPGGSLCAVGGAGGMIRVIGLPRFPVGATTVSAPAAIKKGKGSSTGAASATQAGQILASLQAQEDSVETIAFSDPPLTIMAAGSVDGSIVLFDAAHRFAIRRKIDDAHDEGEAVIRVDFVKGSHVLTSVGNDGVLRRWDVRGGTNSSAKGLLGEWKGHRGGGEGGGILGFVQGGGGNRVVTAGDDGVSLVFDTPLV